MTPQTTTAPLGPSDSGKPTTAGAPPSLVPHAMDLETLLAQLDVVASDGLSTAEVHARLARLGPNRLPTPPGPSVWRRWLAQFENPIVLTLIAAAAIAALNGANADMDTFLARFGDAIAIVLIVVLNAVLGFFQERRAEAALDALQKMQTPNARVRRDGRVDTITAADLVEGDVLELESGDAVPADARLLQTIDLAVEESSLTGESVPVGKDALARIPAEAAMADRSTMLFLGTSIVRGRARAVVVATGPRTELGKLNTLIQNSSEDRKTPLEEKLEVFGHRILWSCLALSVLLFVRGWFHGDRSWRVLLLEAVSLAVAAIPEGLPAITTITLALGMQRMAARGAIVRKLAAIETLGSATVICSDKTGTLTQNEMTVRELFADGTRYLVEGTGYTPEGAIVEVGQGPVGKVQGALAHLLETSALCNNAILEKNETGDWRILGDPTEGALLALAAKGGVHRKALEPNHRIVGELPFDSDRKRMTVVTLNADGTPVAHSKGSADILLPLCDSYWSHQGPTALDEPMRQAILAQSEAMSSEALRVLAVAKRTLRAPPQEPVESRHALELEQSMCFLGLVGMIDPPRPGVREAVASCTDAGIRAVMITGDHKMTAIAIAKEIGLWDAQSKALAGTELDSLSEDTFAHTVDQVRVFARVTAEQKLRIVKALKSRGHVVAMTGDGVNDAPALREAHIGVAMGKAGTDVAREAADMVIADDNFATIVDAVREGRAIYRNIQKFIFFLLSANAGLLVAVFCASFMTGLEPLTPLMILWINLVTNGLPALALGMDPPDETQMKDPPRRTTEGLLGNREFSGIAFVGVWMGACALACYLWPWVESDGPKPARAVAFSLLAISPLFHAISCRSSNRSIFALRPRLAAPLVISLVLSMAVHGIAILVPSLYSVFQTFALTGQQWVVMLSLSASIVPAMELFKWFHHLKSDKHLPSSVMADG